MLVKEMGKQESRLRCRSRPVSPISDVSCKYPAVAFSSTCSYGLPHTILTEICFCTSECACKANWLISCVTALIWRCSGSLFNGGVLGRSHGLNNWVGPIIEGVGESGESFVGGCICSIGWGPGWRKISSDNENTLCYFVLLRFGGCWVW